MDLSVRLGRYIGQTAACLGFAAIFAGLARAKAQGKKLGRPQVSAEKVEAIRQEARASGMGERRIARELRVGVGTVRRLAQQTRIEAL